MSFFNTLIDIKGGSTTNYFISNSGSFGASGSQYDPITVARLLTLSLTSNTTLYFKRNETFELGDINISADSIKVLSYGTGEMPILIGSSSLAGNIWTDEGGGIYYTTLTTTPKWIFVNGIAAKQAETDWITVSSTSGSTVTVNPASISSYSQSIVGAKLWSKQYNFWMNYEYTVTAYNAGTGVITVNAPIFINNGLTLKLVAQKQFLSNNGEWFFDTSNNRLYYRSATNPTGANIRICTKNNAFNLTNGFDGFVADRIDFAQYFYSVINSINNDNISFTNCKFHDLRNDAFVLKGTSNKAVIKNNEIYNCGLNGIRMGPIKNFDISYNNIYEIGQQVSIGMPTDLTYIREGGVGICMNSEGADTVLNGTFIENHIYNTGYCSMIINGENHVIKRNIVHDYCKEFEDGAGLYLIFNAGAGNATQNNLLENNLVYNGNHHTTVIGVYLDNGTNNNIIRNNTVYNNNSYGILANWDTKGNQVINNLVYNNTKQISFRNWVYPNQVWGPTVSNVMNGNIMICANSSQYCFEGFSFTSETNYNPFSSGGSSNNNLFIQPYSGVINIYNGSGETLGDTRTRYGTDAQSTQRTNLSGYSGAVGEIELRKNETKYLIAQLSPSGTYTDPQGTVITNKDILPFTAFVFMKQ